MVLPTLLLSAVQRRIERWRERWRSIRTSCLPPKPKVVKPRVISMGLVVSTTPEHRVGVLLFAKGNAKDKARSDLERPLADMEQGA